MILSEDILIPPIELRYGYGVFLSAKRFRGVNGEVRYDGMVSELLNIDTGYLYN